MHGIQTHGLGNLRGEELGASLAVFAMVIGAALVQAAHAVLLDAPRLAQVPIGGQLGGGRREPALIAHHTGIGHRGEHRGEPVVEQIARGKGVLAVRRRDPIGVVQRKRLRHREDAAAIVCGKPQRPAQLRREPPILRNSPRGQPAPQPLIGKFETQGHQPLGRGVPLAEENGIVLPEREAQKRPVEQPQLVYVIGSHHGGIVAWRASDPRIGRRLPRLHDAGAALRE